MKSCSKNEKKVDMLINNNQNQGENQRKSCDNIELTAMISMQKIGLLNINEKKLISYTEASEFITDVLAFALSSSSSPEGLEIASEVFLASIYGKLQIKFIQKITE